jgi:hypothetical protein
MGRTEIDAPPTGDHQPVAAADEDLYGLTKNELPLLSELVVHAVFVLYRFGL